MSITCVFVLELRPRDMQLEFLTLKSGFQGREHGELGKMQSRKQDVRISILLLISLQGIFGFAIGPRPIYGTKMYRYNTS
jgi:hypothetical protein